MNQEIHKLLGGYATGTLTEEERALLFEASLEDPQLFEALADEQALKDLLDNPAARNQVLQAVAAPPRFSIRAALIEWLDRPKSKALLATAAVLVIAICVRTMWEASNAVPTQESARVSTYVRESPAVQSPPFVEPEKKKETVAEPPVRRFEPPSAVVVQSLPSPTLTGPPETAVGNQSTTATENEQRKSVASLEDAAKSPAAAPPPAAAPELARRPQTSARGEADMLAQLFAAQLQRKTSLGTFENIAIDTPIAASDEIRLQVRTAESGTVILQADDRSPVARYTAAGTTAIFAIPAGARSLIIELASPSSVLFRAVPSQAARSNAASSAAPGSGAGQPAAELRAGQTLTIILNRK